MSTTDIEFSHSVKAWIPTATMMAELPAAPRCYECIASHLQLALLESRIRNQRGEHYKLVLFLYFESVIYRLSFNHVFGRTCFD